MRTLFVKEIASIGAVDSGDNPDAEIVFWKKDSGQSAPVATPDRGDNMKELDMLDGIDLSPLPEDTREALAAHIQTLEAAAQPAEPVEVDVEKNLPEEVQELLAKARADAETARQELAEKDEALAVEVAKRRNAEIVAKYADDGLEPLLGPADEVGPVLRELEDAAPDAFAKVYPNLVAAAQRLDMGNPFGESGEEDAEEASYEARRDAYVQKRRESGDNRPLPVLRKEFVELNPDAVAASREEK